MLSMPELPEVETIRRQLERAIKGAEIKNVIVRNSKPLNVSREKFISAVRGAKIKEVGRRAKLLIFYLTPSTASSRTPHQVRGEPNAGSLILLFHLKMTGRMLLARKDEPPTKHTHLIFELSGNNNLFFEDYRKFGFVKLLEEKDLKKYFTDENYGTEPLSKNFTYKIMKECLLARKNKKIKQILMEQSCVAGIGNIYAAEICFFAGARPDRKIFNIKETEFKKIYAGIKKILKAAIASGGSSSDAYVDAYGKKGRFVPRLKVYGRGGERCLRCGGLVKKYKLGGRGTFFCPECQR